MTRGALAVVLLLGARTGLADCANPRAFLVPEQGTLPKNPVLHLFLPTWSKSVPDARVTDGEGKPLEARVTALASSDAFHVLRVEIDSGDAAEISVDFEGYAMPDARYTVDRVPQRKLAPGEAVTVRGAESESFAWSCSHNATRNLTVSVTAPVYRVEWATSANAFHQGERREVYVPHRITDLSFRWRGAPPIPVEPLLKLGYLNCTGANFDWKNGGVWASVVAIFPDGSETPLGEPARLDPPSAPTTRRGR